VDRNLIDKDEYPQSAEIEQRCVAMLADPWHAPGWRARGGTGRPNLVMGTNVQVCWESFCRYWDVEARATSGRSASSRSLGSTFDRTYEPVADIAAALDALEFDRGIDVPVHVDAASGGFIAPFLEPDLMWDFRLERVRSINASGHKYGLCTRASAGRCGARRTRSPASSCSRWTTSAGRWPTTAHVLRVVVRDGFSRDLAEVFAGHLREITTALQQHGGAIRVRSGDRTGFHH
jgi:glutamate/tyrosine decarboxylase-like PLP-dependent enzyme